VAFDVGAVDQVTLQLSEGVESAELIILATPIRTFPQLLPTVTAAARQDAVLTEVASTKARVIETVTAHLADRPDLAYVPSHPMAGSEQRGAAHARADMFEDSVCILTPLRETPPEELNRVRSLWQRLGASVHEMTPAGHDRLVARISHLPHLAAAALMRCLSAREGHFAGGGLLDTTRIASGDPRLWRDICETNSEEIGSAISCCAEALQEMRAMLEEGRFEALEELLADAKRKRDSLLARRD
jgi:prephenate dehydrogenase